MKKLIILFAITLSGILTAQTFTSEPNVVYVGWEVGKYSPDSAGVTNAMLKADELQNTTHQIITVDFAPGNYNLGSGQIVLFDSVAINFRLLVTVSSGNSGGTITDNNNPVTTTIGGIYKIINTTSPNNAFNIQNSNSKISRADFGYFGTNTFVGYNCGINITTGGYNSAYGYEAMYNSTTADNNVIVGYQGLSLNISGDANTGVGYGVLGSNTTGFRNTCLGNEALKYNTTGQYNIAIGSQAGIIDGSSVENTTSQNSIYIGSSSSPLSNGGDNEIVIGTFATGSGTNTTTIGNESTTKTILNGNVQTQSYNFADASIVTGTADSIVIDFVTNLPALTAGLEVTFIAEGSNTGAATLILDGGAEKNIYEEVGAAPNTLEANDIRTGMIVRVLYDGTRWVIISPSGN